MSCPTCADPNFLGWTSGTAADGAKFAEKLAVENGCSTKAVKCESYGYDVVRVES